MGTRPRLVPRGQCPPRRRRGCPHRQTCRRHRHRTARRLGGRGSLLVVLTRSCPGASPLQERPHHAPAPRSPGEAVVTTPRRDPTAPRPPGGGLFAFGLPASKTFDLTDERGIVCKGHRARPAPLCSETSSAKCTEATPSGCDHLEAELQRVGDKNHADLSQRH